MPCCVYVKDLYYAVCVYKRCTVPCCVYDKRQGPALLNHYAALCVQQKTHVIKLLCPSVCTTKDVNMSSCVHDK